MSNPGAGYPWVSESIAREGIPLAAASGQRATSMVGNCAKRKFPVGPRHLIAKKSTSSQSILLLVQNGIFGSANLAPCDRTYFLGQRRLQHRIEVRCITPHRDEDSEAL
jgi:hypothetical protein